MNNVDKIKSKQNNNVLFVIILSIISFVYFIFSQNFIPNRFQSDSYIIRSRMVDPINSGGSYQSTANFFKGIGLSYNTPSIIIHIFAWIVFILILLTAVRINKNCAFKSYQELLLLFFMIMYGFYFTNYSKDIIVLLFFVIAINIHHIDKNLLINVIIAILIYGYFFRIYWLLIGVVFIFIIIISRRNIKINILYVIISIILVILIYNIYKHGQITNIRVGVNLQRINFSVGSIIKNIVSNNSFITDIINYIYVLVSLFIPIQGIPSLNMIIYYLWILSILVFCVRNRRNLDYKFILLLFVYINIQALFEPDFGSVFRHQLAWFPIIYYSLVIRNKSVKSA